MAAGIYTITNIVTGKVYVGSTLTGFGPRWTNHRVPLRRGTHPNKYLQYSWNKHGESNFKFEILEEWECDNERDNNIILSQEQYWINMIGSSERDIGYNICSVAGNTYGVKRTEEEKRKISAAQIGKKRGPASEERKRKIGDGNRGKKRTPEDKAKQSTRSIGRDVLTEESIRKIKEKLTGREFGEDTIKKMEAAAQNRRYGIICIQTGEFFPRVKDACSKFNINISCIQDVLKGRREFTSNLSFRYATSEEISLHKSSLSA